MSSTKEKESTPKSTEEKKPAPKKSKPQSIPEEERLEFLDDLKASRTAYKERNYSKAYDILLNVMLRLEMLGHDFHEHVEIRDPDLKDMQPFDIRDRFYDLLRGDIKDDSRIIQGYRKEIQKSRQFYTTDVWNFMSFEMKGEPELLAGSADPNDVEVIKLVHLESGGIMNMADWYKVRNYMIRELDKVAPKLERMMLSKLSKKGMAVY